jgi:cytochrome d ubiquinol oxidase subunit II
MSATAVALFPLLLRSTVAAAYDVTAYGASTGRHALLVGLSWWIPALLLAVGYFSYLFRSFAGKVRELHY